MSYILTHGFMHVFSSRVLSWAPFALSAKTKLGGTLLEYRRCGDEGGGEEPPTFPAGSQKDFGLSLSEPFRILLFRMFMEPCKLHDFPVLFVSSRIQG